MISVSYGPRKAGRSERLFRFGNTYSMVKYGSVSLSCDTLPTFLNFNGNSSIEKIKLMCMLF